MLKCPSCDHENVAGTQFCEMCGEELVADNAASTPAASAVDAPAAVANGDIECPACGNMNPSDNLVCEVCGTDLKSDSSKSDEESAVDTTTPGAVPDDEADDESIPAPSSGDTLSAALADADSQAANAADASTPSGDGDNASTPSAPADDASAVSLSPGMVKLVVEQGMSVGKQFVLGDAEILIGREDEDEEIYPDIDLSDQDEGFVHRKHAQMNFEDGALTVTHLGGANRTKVNNRPIPDNEAQSVKLGDKIAFGKVVLRVLPL